MPNQKRNITYSEKLRKNKPSFRPKRSVLIFCFLLIITVLIQIKPASSRTIRVPTDYARIQWAVGNATAGDIIQVAPGIYYEHIFVNKSLTIVGANPKTTIIDGTANGTIFILDTTASRVSITGFTIRNAGDKYNAITSERPGPAAINDYHQITNNIITTSQYGVYLSYSSQNTIFNNTFIGNPFAAIYLTKASSNNITGNTIRNSAYGIKMISSCLNNIIIGNTISQTSYAIHITSTSTGTTIRNNNLNGRTAGVYSSSDSTTIDHNTILEGAYGIYLYNNKLCPIYYNTLKNNSYSIRLYWTTDTTTSHTVKNNKVLYADWAIEVTYSYGNTFQGNWLQQNTYGIYMSYSGSNTIYRNNFINNNMQAFAGVGTGNAWNKTGNGNYWSDYTGKDANGDGIGDTPYRITPIGYDYYPLMNTWSEHDIEIQSVSPSTYEATTGATINITVVVKNRANISVTETFTVTAKYNATPIETKTVTSLAQGATQALTYHWNTTGVASGNYTISAEATTVPDELNTDNNNLTDGVVKIKVPLIGDINRDGKINNQDLIILVQAYGSIKDGPYWNPDADLNKDNIINITDLYLLSKNYGETV